MVDAGLTSREIAARTDRSQGTVRYWLKRYGLRTKHAVGPRPKVQVTTDQGCARHGSNRLAEVGGRTLCLTCRSEAVSARRRRVKAILVEEAGGRCTLCGYDRCLSALQFHHLDPELKLFGVGSRGLTNGIERLREETAKCVLLCANCHAEVEAGLSELPSAAVVGGPPGRRLRG